jgi:hypothetical protein
MKIINALLVAAAFMPTIAAAQSVLKPCCTAPRHPTTADCKQAAAMVEDQAKLLRQWASLNKHATEMLARHPGDGVLKFYVRYIRGEGKYLNDSLTSLNAQNKWCRKTTK